MKPHGVRGISKHYNLQLEPKLGHGTCEIRRIPCVCVEFTNIMDNPWAPGVDHTQKPCYQPVVDCTYWPVLCSFNDWNIIQFTNKIKYSEEFDEE